MLKEQGYLLRKSPVRDPQNADFGHFVIFDEQGHVALDGYSGATSPYTLSLDECDR
jgi:hypothetical protein